MDTLIQLIFYGPAVAYREDLGYLATSVSIGLMLCFWRFRKHWTPRAIVAGFFVWLAGISCPYAKLSGWPPSWDHNWWTVGFVGTVAVTGFCYSFLWLFSVIMSSGGPQTRVSRCKQA